MVSVIRFLVSKLMSPIWRTIPDENDGFYGGDAEEIRQVQDGVVTQFCQNYGLIDHAVYFTMEVVLGGVPLQVGDSVQALAVRDGVHGGWRAVKVEKKVDYWEGDRTSSNQDTEKLRPLIGTITSCDQNGGFINQTTFFPRSALCEGFEPMKGDWVQGEYFINPTEWSSQVLNISPLRYQRMNQVRVTSVFGNNGVVEDSVYFNLESLLLPAGYRPTPGDQVSVVVVESNQSFYCWRALCMAPINQHSPNGLVAPSPELDSQPLLQNKEGLEVSEETQFGSLMLGENKQLHIWIHNTSSEPQTLTCCELAGWDSGKQFTFSPDSSSVNTVADQSVQGNSEPVNGLGYSSGMEKEPNESKVRCSEEDGEEMSVLVKMEKNLEIPPREKVVVTVGCQAKNLGGCSELLLLRFSSFTIWRRLEVSVSSSLESLLKPRAPYCSLAAPPPAFQPSSQVVTVMAPAPPQRIKRRNLPSFLGAYMVPQAVRNCVEANSDVLVVQPALGEPLCLSSMMDRFSTLLWLEELQAEKELKEFSISGAMLTKGVGNLHLEVPGLSEGRPSLYIGDKIVLKKLCIGGIELKYIAFVTEINKEDVSLRVNFDFLKNYLGEPLDVEFTLNRLTLRRCHCALEQTKHFGENVLFPKIVQLQTPLWSGEWDSEEASQNEENKGAIKGENKEHSENVENPTTLDMVSVGTQTKTDLSIKAIPKPGRFFNCNLNPAQKEAVKRIINGECRPTPYILFGPPGTGKTITLIEAILQVFHRVPMSRILVCTPSNSAADLICIRLHDSGFLQTTNLARVNATCRHPESIPEVLHQYCHAGEDIRNAAYHRVVVSTCSSAGMFYQISLQVGHFTHAFLDEAGQATEPESLIPLGLLSERTGQIVLAGDPKQLGPVVKSKLAEAFGLGVSLLERLMASPLYSCNEKGYNPVLVTKLVYNYRSHEVLLALPSRLFYGGELCVRSQRAVVDSLCHWNRLPTKGFPLLFHGVRGTEMREGTNPSWFNPGEAVQAMLYCCQLSKRLYRPISLLDIGVITPYKKQVEKIRLLLYQVGLGDIKVGSVEEFQGQEYLVIILSTVRSNETIPSSDLQSALGFLSNPKRFNVAITRPKALLIVIGNPHVLIKDPCFRALLQYTYENGAFLGCDPPVLLQGANGAAFQKDI